MQYELIIDRLSFTKQPLDMTFGAQGADSRAGFIPQTLCEDKDPIVRYYSALAPLSSLGQNSYRYSWPIPIH
jgi:hypothetical protein